MTELQKRLELERLARELGFTRVGVTGVARTTRAEYLRRWLDREWAGRMDYLHRHREVREEPARLLEGARSVIVAALNYYQPEPEAPDDQPRGRIARYAWGRDYHRVVKKRLWKLVDRLQAELGEQFQARVCVDTAPVLERELAARAGVGWIGKNTMVLNAELGSYFYLGEIVTTLVLPPDAPAVDHCGSCRRCLEACPTGALPEPYRMNASRCISYLTIELREEIPAALRPLMGDWVFGCDICQEVCPFNRRAPVTADPDLAVRPPAPRPLLAELAGWTPAEYDRRLRGSTIRRATLNMLRRNTSIALHNTELSSR
jgi:epoxyqueuosine reductase